jgi:hypothetical protein
LLGTQLRLAFVLAYLFDHACDLAMLSLFITNLCAATLLCLAHLPTHEAARFVCPAVPRTICCLQHPLSHPEWPLDLAVVSAGFRVCMEKGCMVDFRPLLSGMSLLQFYPGLMLQKVQAGGCTAYWMTLKGGELRVLNSNALFTN